MPRGAAVIRYEGARGATWRVKYLDADDARCRKRSGLSPEWDRRKTERALGARLADVDKGMRKPARRTFADLAVQQVVRNEITTPRSRAGRRTLPLGSMAASALEEQYQSTRYRDPGCIVFSHPALGTPLDPSKLTTYARKALTAAGMPLSFRPSHGLRHTALTETAAAGVPSMFVQAKAGHAHGSTTERYPHAHRTSYPDAAELAEARLFTTTEIPDLPRYKLRYKEGRSTRAPFAFLTHLQGVCSSPGATRTHNPPVNSRMLCQLSYRGRQRGRSVAAARS
jgi:hypothetical protein